MLQAEKISYGHGKVLVNLDPQESILLAKKIVEMSWSVRDLENYLKDKPQSQKKKNETYFSEKIDTIKKQLETKTGFHIKIKESLKGKGTLNIKFNNEAEFNDICEFLLR